MDAKEVELRGKAITKSYAAGDPSSTLLDLLKGLREGVRATEDLLRSTRIGVTVNKLRQHKDPTVAKQANELVGKWKTDVRKAASGSATPKAANGIASPAPAVQSSTPPKIKKHNVAPENRSHKTDKVDWKVTGNDTRDNCVRLMYDGLAHMSEDLPEDVLRMARDVEVAAYNVYQSETSEQYKTKLRSLYQNLKNKSNPQLRKRILSGEITAKRFVVMTHEELKSAERRAEDARLEKENMREAMVAQVEKSISATFTCGKCKQKKVAYSQAQTRSADEPMTTFCECTNCGNRWKFS
ncbi:transcription elongation factor S-II [Mytilinidion resinicola]|uniref:Transcription elongation factor n=1 Tax=Mytilinidion resinicola TaxID=574789 RepID=A0A6A6YIA8_9PEZI|nr:transcription elongation factor S-II [Mytilinidion resinicola]KAF2808531.1 transcription elongation factor S-II [Mytilinidion resinicola]